MSASIEPEAPTDPAPVQADEERPEPELGAVESPSESELPSSIKPPSAADTPIMHVEPIRPAGEPAPVLPAPATAAAEPIGAPVESAPETGPSPVADAAPIPSPKPPPPSRPCLVPSVTGQPSTWWGWSSAVTAAANRPG